MLQSKTTLKERADPSLVFQLAEAPGLSLGWAGRAFCTIDGQNEEAVAFHTVLLLISLDLTSLHSLTEYSPQGGIQVQHISFWLD